MSTGEKKPTAQPPATHPPPTQPAQQPSNLPQPVKNPLISRRTFFKLAVGGSVVLVGASFAQSVQFAEPIIPPANADPKIGKAQDLDTSLSKAGSGAKFYSWPWSESVSAYYRNWLIRLPDNLIPDKSDLLAHFVSFNSTCVHLQCLVNYASVGSDWRLVCPCHGSQYRMPDAVPVAGPAFYLGLKPLPKVTLGLDSDGNLVAKELIGQIGFGRDL